MYQLAKRNQAKKKLSNLEMFRSFAIYICVAIPPKQLYLKKKLIHQTNIFQMKMNVAAASTQVIYIKMIAHDHYQPIQIGTTMSALINFRHITMIAGVSHRDNIHIWKQLKQLLVVRINACLHLKTNQME